MRTGVGTGVLCALVALTPAVAGCSGGGGAAHPPGSTSTSAASGPVATRWWSDDAAGVGTTIDPRAPLAVAATLHESRREYCTMLRQTVAGGRSILPGVSAKDPALLLATEAFVAEIRAVAPATVSARWRVLGNAVVALVASGGDAAKIPSVDAGAVRQAATAIAADAKRACHVDLAAVT